MAAVELNTWLAEMPEEGVEVSEETIEQPPLLRSIPGVEEQQEVPQPPLVHQRWKITSERGAVWAMRKLATLRDEKAEHAATARAEQDRIKEWLDTVSAPLDSSIEHFAFLLDEYHRGIIDGDLETLDAPSTLAGPVSDEAWAKMKHKTLSLPNGKVEARRQPGKFAVVDEDAALEYLREHAPHLIHWDASVKATEFDEGGAQWNVSDGVWEFPISITDEEIGLLARRKYPDARLEVTPLATTLWVAIPGVVVDGAGVVKFTPKPAS